MELNEKSGFVSVDETGKTVREFQINKNLLLSSSGGEIKDCVRLCLFYGLFPSRLMTTIMHKSIIDII